MEFIKEKPTSDIVHEMTNWYDRERLNLDYQVNVKFWNDSREEGNITWIGMDIDLERKFTRNFMELILPPALLVFVSWVCEKLVIYKFIEFRSRSAHCNDQREKLDGHK